MEEEDLVELIKKAAENLDEAYFKLLTTYEPSGVVREKAFCYEFYHHLRLLMPKGCPLTLNGEIDKRGHLLFAAEDRKNPDFVLHIPGEMARNTIIVEVKGTLNDVKGIRKDFRTLLTFVTKYQYKIGVFLLYNHSLDELRLIDDAELFAISNREDAEKVVILAIRDAKRECEETLLSKLFVADMPRS